MNVIIVGHVVVRVLLDQYQDLCPLPPPVHHQLQFIIQRPTISNMCHCLTLLVIIGTCGISINSATHTFTSSSLPKLPIGWRKHFRIEIANPKLEIKPRIIEAKTEPDWMKFLRPPYMPDNSKIDQKLKMYREVSRSSRVFDEEYSTFPPIENDWEDVSYQPYHVTNDIRPNYQDKSDWAPIYDQAPWVPLPTTTNTRYHTSPSIKTSAVHPPVKVSSKQSYSRKEPIRRNPPSNQVQLKFSTFPVQKTLQSLKKPSVSSFPVQKTFQSVKIPSVSTFPVQKTFQSVKKPSVSTFPVQKTFQSVKRRPSDYQRKTRRKWQNLARLNQTRRQPKRLSNYQQSSHVRARNISPRNRKSDHMDWITKSKLSSALALSIIGSLLAI